MDKSVKEYRYVRKLHHRITLLIVNRIEHESELHSDTAEKTDDLCERSVADARPDVNQEAPFFKLPAELRNRIYEYLIPGKKRVICFRKYEPKVWYRTKIAITQVCRGIRQETIPMLYGKHTFVLQLSSAVALSRAWIPWLHDLDPLARSSIKKICLSTTMCECKSASEAVDIVRSEIKELNLVRVAIDVTLADDSIFEEWYHSSHVRNCRFCKRNWLSYTEAENFAVAIKFKRQEFAIQEDVVVPVVKIAASMYWDR
jgi:hypothetical protein